MGHVPLSEAMTPKPLRVLIADDHQLVTEGLSIVLERADLDMVGVARTGRQAVAMTMDLEPDVVLMDIRMPDMDGLQALAAIKAACPQVLVIILTSYANPDYLARAIAMGADGYLTKDKDSANIPAAIKAVAAGEAILNREVLQMAMVALSDITSRIPMGPHDERPDLTAQELRVLTLIAEGLDNDTIAEILSVTRNTVKTHVRNLFTKIGVSDRTQAAVWAIRTGLVV